MRLLLHDYSGHPFQVQLSRALARRGHTVLHLSCPSYRSGKGALERRDDDPDGFSVEFIRLSSDFSKYSPVRRWVQEVAYGRRLARRVEAFAPDVVLSGNTPLFSQRILARSCRRSSIPFVFWQQDIYSFGMKSAVAGLPVIGTHVGDRFVAMERRLLLDSDGIVVISEDFLPTLDVWQIPTDRVEVIENWAPLEELSLGPRDNGWAAEHGLLEKIVFLYSGTIGRKHDPDILLKLAAHFRDRPDVVVVVVSGGERADWLRDRGRERGLENLKVLPFQPYGRFSDVLASGDVLVVMLEPDAGAFSVPSKVLSYLCAGRPLLASLPTENLAARVVSESGGGLVADCTDHAAFLRHADTLAGDAALRGSMGARARRFAEAAFDIDGIADRFEVVLGRATAHAAGPR